MKKRKAKSVKKRGKCERKAIVFFLFFFSYMAVIFRGKMRKSFHVKRKMECQLKSGVKAAN